MKAPTMPDAGAGVRIALLDSGVRDSALRLSPGQQVNGRSFVDGTASWQDWDGHGTQCASRLIDSQIGLVPSARLTALRVRRGACATLASLTSALKWLLDTAPDSRWDLVLFGVGLAARSRDEAPLNEIHDLVQELDRRGALVIAPAGNRALTDSPFVDHPARYASVLSVGALLPPEHGALAWAGNRDLGRHAAKLDFLVQGCQLPTRTLHGALAPGFGTSFAAADAVGHLARYLQWRRSLPTAAPGQPSAERMRTELSSMKSLNAVTLLEPAIQRAISGEGICERSA